MKNEAKAALALVDAQGKLQKILFVLVQHVLNGALTFVAAFDIYVAIAQEFCIELSAAELKDAADKLEIAELGEGLKKLQ
jgi:hypothetical protein